MKVSVFHKEGNPLEKMQCVVWAIVSNLDSHSEHREVVTSNEPAMQFTVKGEFNKGIMHHMCKRHEKF